MNGGPPLQPGDLVERSDGEIGVVRRVWLRHKTDGKVEWYARVLWRGSRVHSTALVRRLRRVERKGR